MSQESTGIHWLLSDTNFILSSIEIYHKKWHPESLLPLRRATFLIIL